MLNILKRQIAEVPNVTQINDVKDHDSVVKKGSRVFRNATHGWNMPCLRV